MPSFSAFTDQPPEIALTVHTVVSSDFNLMVALGWLLEAEDRLTTIVVPLTMFDWLGHVMVRC